MSLTNVPSALDDYDAGQARIDVQAEQIADYFFEMRRQAEEEISFEKRLLASCFACEFSQAEIARQLGVSRNLVNAWHLGRRRIVSRYAQQLADILLTSHPVALQSLLEEQSALLHERIDQSLQTFQTTCHSVDDCMQAPLMVHCLSQLLHEKKRLDAIRDETCRRT